ncbi:MAG: glycosyltransferase family 2 protein [Chitinophagales bacterium]|nr:glycosyltransferase family 2 protein [Chitinophagales bacterium]
MPSLSAVIITFNEEKNIARCLRSLQGVADDLVVIDAFSTDQTKAISETLGARVIEHRWEGYAASRNFGSDQAHNDWIVYIDADEELTDELKQSILSIKTNPFTLFYRCKILINYCGKWIRHSGWYPGIKIRMFDRRTARWKGNVHEKIEINDENARIELLYGNVLHYAYSSIEEHKKKNERYSALMAIELFNQGKKISSFSIKLRQWFTFIRSYILKLGFLDGYYGYKISQLSGEYTRMKYEKLLALYADKTSVHT